MSQIAIPSATRTAIGKRGAQLLIFLLLMGICLFGSAGRLNWWNAWLFLGIHVIGIIGTGSLLIRKSPDLIAERASISKEAKRWDKLLAPAMAMFGPIGIWITAGLDARNHWSDRIPGAGEVAGVALMVAGYALVSWAMFSNRFFSGLVRIQKERGHKVVVGGPYRYLRHPGYLGMIAFTLATPLILNSMWAFVPAVLATAIAMVRTALEDRTLRVELEGYADYAQRVRNKLVPGIW